MSKINDGGVAFPCEWDTQLGMTLRDWFAGKALQGFCANPAVFAGNEYSGWALVNCTEDQLATVCHRLADAMISTGKEGAE